MGEIAATTICQGLSFLPPETPAYTLGQLSLGKDCQGMSLELQDARTDPKKGIRQEETESRVTLLLRTFFHQTQLSSLPSSPQLPLVEGLSKH